METGTGQAAVRTDNMYIQPDLLKQAQNQTLPTKRLVTKLCEIMEVIGYVPKNGFNKFHNYAYVREADIVDALRKELTKRKIFVYPSIISQNTISNASGDITNLMVRWTFEDAETGETRECIIPGSGQDKGDKGVYKAMTGSSKYFLMKAFFVPTGDDPEAEDGKKSEGTVHTPKDFSQPKLLPKTTAAPVPTTNTPSVSGQTKSETLPATYASGLNNELPTKQEKTAFIKHLRQYINVILPEKNIEDGADKLQHYVLGFNGVSDTKALTKAQWLTTLGRLDEATTEGRLAELLAG
jgi:hypothetical protein